MCLLKVDNDKKISNKIDKARGLLLQSLHLYCASLDSADVDIFLSLWTSDAYLDFSERFKGTPKDFIKSVTTKRDKNSYMNHKLGEVEIDLDEGLMTARSVSGVIATVKTSSSDGYGARRIFGTYIDRWEFEDKWLIDHRIFKRDRQIALA